MPARVVPGEVFPGKPAAGFQGHRKPVGHGELTGRARRRRKTQGTGLARHGHVQGRRARPGQPRCGASRDCDDRRAVCDQRLHRGQQFLRLPAVGQGDDHVPLRHLPAVAVVAVGRIEEIRLRPGALQRGRQLAADMAGLAHAGDVYASACRFRRSDDRNGFVEVRGGQILLQSGKRLGGPPHGVQSGRAGRCLGGIGSLGFHRFRDHIRDGFYRFRCPCHIRASNGFRRVRGGNRDAFVQGIHRIPARTQLRKSPRNAATYGAAGIGERCRVP